MNLVRTGDWSRAKRVVNRTNLAKAIKKTMGQSLQRAALLTQTIIKKGIVAGRGAPNKPLTIALKGSSSQLIDSGSLLRNINIKTINVFAVFVGVLTGAKGKKGKSVINYAKIMETGAVVPITRRMKKWLIYTLKKKKKLNALGKKTGGSKGMIVIPPRPFLEPGWEEARPGVEAEYRISAGRIWNSIP